MRRFRACSGPLVVLVSALLASAGACAGSERGGSGGGGGEGGEGPSYTSTTTWTGTATADPVTEHVTAAEGGTIADPGGAVELTIPPGAIEGEVDVTLTIGAPANGSLTNVYHFAPAGLAVDAFLSIRIAGVEIPAGSKAVLAVLEGASFVEVPGSFQGAEAVEGPISSLASYSVVARELPTGGCEASCMSQPGAECCTSCGCSSSYPCYPQCPVPTQWDCEMGCCFDYSTYECAVLP